MRPSAIEAGIIAGFAVIAIMVVIDAQQSPAPVTQVTSRSTNAPYACVGTISMSNGRSMAMLVECPSHYACPNTCTMAISRMNKSEEK